MVRGKVMFSELYCLSVCPYGVRWERVGTSCSGTVWGKGKVHPVQIMSCGVGYPNQVIHTPSLSLCPARSGLWEGEGGREQGTG